MKFTVSVVMATFNRATYIAESIESILGQTVSPDEIIVVDDGSTDDTAKVVASFGDRIRYARKANGGRSSALNLGLAMARGDWIWFFDDDDVALPNSLEVRLSALGGRPDADVVYSGQIMGRDGTDLRILSGHPVPAPLFTDDEILLGVLKEYPFRLQGMLIRKARVLDIGGFDESFLRSQDYEFYTRLFQDCKVVGLSTPTFIWRNHFGPRGPLSDQHDGSRRDDVWMEYDGKLGRKIRAEFPLGMYLVPPQRVDELRVPLRRLALFNRLTVMAGKGLLSEMLLDLVQASALDAGDLTREERADCIRSMSSPYFLTALLRDPRALLAPLAKSRSRVSRQAIGCFARGLWYAGRKSERPSDERRSLATISGRLAFYAGAKALFLAYSGR